MTQIAETTENLNTETETNELNNEAETNAELNNNIGEVEGLEISIDDGSQPSEDETTSDETKPWVKELRKTQRELQKELRAAKEELSKVKQPEKLNALPEKPTLQSCGYDEDIFEAKVLNWNNKKLQIEAQEKAEKEKVEAGKKDWETKLNSYNTSKTQLKVSDFNEAEDNVISILSVVQQGIIINGALKPEILIYAIGKNQKLLESLSKITDPIKFAFEIARTEGKLKVIETRKAPTPEKTISGTGNLSANASDAHLKALEAEADRTGDRTKVIAYKRTLKNKT